MPKFRVARRDELRVGEMKPVQAGDQPLLLVRLQEGFYAVGALCSHYEAPLADGALCESRIICPWHHATFDVKSGKLLEPPGLDDLPTFPVSIEGEEVFVEIPEKPASKPILGRDPSVSRTIVVIGSGCAGAYAVESLREEGFKGRIVWLAPEEFPPIDRPLLSKGYLSGEIEENWLPLRRPEFYEARDIEVVRKRAIELDAVKRTMTLEDGETLSYETAILATGATARRLSVPGKDLEGIFTLHIRQDAEQLLASLSEVQRAVVVGAGFIGMEVAQSLRKRNLEVTVVAPEEVPFERIVGREIGNVFLRVHEENGIRFFLGDTVAAFEGERRVRQVRLQSGEVLEADLVVVGIGVRPNTDFVHGVCKAEDGSIPVDAQLRAAEGLYAVGDLARFPDWRTGEPVRIEHWRVAAQHGRLAARNALGQAKEFRSVPYFWTRQFDKSLLYLGHAKEWEEIQVSGNIDEGRFIAYFLRGGKVHAVAGMERDRELAALNERIRREGLLIPRNLP